jgi:hypothetical protein
MTTRAIEKLIGRYVEALGLDPNVTVDSLRVTALTTAREQASEIIDLQDIPLPCPITRMHAPLRLDNARQP